jgi:hypothetical protein
MSVALSRKEALMKRFEMTTLDLELVYSDKDKALALLTSLAADRSVSVNILKARITEHSAWLQLELQGQTPRVQETAALLNREASIQDPSWRPFSRAS